MLNHEEVMRPKIFGLTRTDGLAGQVKITCRVQYADLPATRVEFFGSVRGTPGPVVMVTPTLGQITVSHPGRHGERFDIDWVRRFWEA